MKLLATQTIRHGGSVRVIELLHGDLAHLPPEHRVDLLTVSAFPNDYLATRTSLIGALGRVGLSVEELAAKKQTDLRQQYSCWLSRPVGPAYNFRHVLCIESGWRGTPPEITDDLFRAVAPYLLAEFPNGSIAMPLIGAGDQGWPAEEMLQTILRAAVGWIERGLPLRLLKIVINRRDTARRLTQVFRSFMDTHVRAEVQTDGVAEPAARIIHDVFLSYSHKEADAAKYFVDKLTKSSGPTLRVFHDSTSLREGAAWLLTTADAIDASRRVAVFYSQTYWTSKNFQMEFLAALTRQVDTDETVLFPIYLSDANIPYMFRNLQYSDCRVNDLAKLCGVFPAYIGLGTRPSPAPIESVRGFRGVCGDGKGDCKSASLPTSHPNHTSIAS